uniref:Uncharacterized protein n=1 Tax=Anopheles minimus TaxID=112268 RepID=A0A182WNQ1_9DIPT
MVEININTYTHKPHSSIHTKHKALVVNLVKYTRPMFHYLFVYFFVCLFVSL